MGRLTHRKLHSLNLSHTVAGRASFTSKDDKLKAGQTKEGVLNSEKSELLRWPKIGLFIVELSCD